MLKIRCDKKWGGGCTIHVRVHPLYALADILIVLNVKHTQMLLQTSKRTFHQRTLSLTPRGEGKPIKRTYFDNIFIRNKISYLRSHKAKKQIEIQFFIPKNSYKIKLFFEQTQIIIIVILMYFICIHIFKKKYNFCSFNKIFILNFYHGCPLRGKITVLDRHYTQRGIFLSLPLSSNIMCVQCTS